MWSVWWVSDGVHQPFIQPNDPIHATPWPERHYDLCQQRTAGTTAVAAANAHADAADAAATDATTTTRRPIPATAIQAACILHEAVHNQLPLVGPSPPILLGDSDSRLWR